MVEGTEDHHRGESSEVKVEAGRPAALKRLVSKKLVQP
jgi:hypothetical protein